MFTIYCATNIDNNKVYIGKNKGSKLYRKNEHLNVAINRNDIKDISVISISYTKNLILTMRNN